VLDAGLLVRYESLRDATERSNAWTDKQLARIRRGMAEMAGGLGERAWCHGERYSLADIALGCCLGWLGFRKPGDVDWHAQYPSLAKHYEKLMARPAFAETVPQVPK
jgi:glutathione S-transferase